MKLRDLTNKEVATIANCASEPIHIPGSIQPHGMLLAVDEDLRIQLCSANVETYFLRQPAELLQQPLAFLNKDIADAVIKANESKTYAQKPVTLAVAGREWTLFLHPSEKLLLLELELSQPFALEADLLFDQTSAFVSFISRSKSLRDFCQWVAVQVRELTGYDRVMVYRFDADYNGEVYAESRDERFEPFLNLHYPHTDIPEQARELYLRNVIRMITDVTYTPVPLFTADETLQNPDLSDVGLRSVSPIHIQYLKNMKVGATLTISLLLDGKLWGLIACHHYSPKHLPYFQRKAALMYGHFLTSQIKVRQVAEDHQVTVVVEAHLQQLLNSLQIEGDFGIKFQQLTSLLAVANASGVAVLHHGQVYEAGFVPSRDKMKALFQWLAEHINGLQFSTSHLAKHYPDAAKIADAASGIFYHKLGDPKKDAIIWFREEAVRTINWAGDPMDTIKKEQTANKLTPRTSFAIYKESIRQHSHEWLLPEVNAASRFANTLQNQFHLAYLQSEEARQRLLNEQLQKANKELANINWITTHDLKEPVRKILLFSSKAMGDEGKEVSEGMLASLTKIQTSARRMQRLVEDILGYSLTDDKSAAFVPTNLDGIMKEVIETFEDDFHQKQIVFTTAKMPTISAIPYQVRQLFINLISNSIKFAKEGQRLVIEVTCSKAQGVLPFAEAANSIAGYHLIHYRDNGIGFSAANNGRVFDIFYRSHAAGSFEGTGIGLAICKRIVENHNGFITAFGEEGVGASFHIYFPEMVAGNVQELP